MQAEENAKILKILGGNESPNRQVKVPLVSTPTTKTPKRLKVNTDKEAPNQNGASASIVQGESTTTMKTPRRLKVSIDKELPKHNAASVNVVEAETAKKPTAEVSPRKANQRQEEEEPEAKKRRKGRPTNSERTKGEPVKQRISNRTTKSSRRSVGVINLNEEQLLHDHELACMKFIQPKVASAGVKAESLKPTISTQKVQAKTDVKVPKVNETPATNDSLLPPKKSATVTPGTARKRVAGEGRTATLQKIMLEFPNLCDPNVFSDILHKTYGGRFEASKVFECLTTSDLKQAIVKKFSPSDLMALAQSSGGNAGEQFLSEATSEVLLHELLSREEIKNSSKMSKETKKAINTSGLINLILDVVSVDDIVKKLCARPDFEKLYNEVLKNSPEKLADETKKTFVKVLLEQFEMSEIVDISHDALKVVVHNHKKN